MDWLEAGSGGRAPIHDQTATGKAHSAACLLLFNGIGSGADYRPGYDFDRFVRLLRDATDYNIFSGRDAIRFAAIHALNALLF